MSSQDNFKGILLHLDQNCFKVVIFRFSPFAGLHVLKQFTGRRMRQLWSCHGCPVCGLYEKCRMKCLIIIYFKPDDFVRKLFPSDLSFKKKEGNNLG